jgi:very-short-patch-repair endonuclease
MKRPQDNPRRAMLKREHARELRTEMTDAERMLWALLRRKHVAGLRFRRQQPIGPYIVDFYCPAAKLIVELDGGQHGETRRREYDELRTRWLQGNGYRVLRFSNGDFLRDRDAVLDGVWRAVRMSGVPLPEAADAAPLPKNSSPYGENFWTLPQGEGEV